MNNFEQVKNSIDIPKEIDLAVIKGIERGKKEKLISKKRIRNKKFIAAAATSLVVISSAYSIKPDLVMAIPGVSSIFKLFTHDSMGQPVDKFQEFSSSVNKTVEKNGIKVTVEEIAVDDNTLAITTEIEGIDLSKAKGGGPMEAIELNGKTIESMNSEDKKIDDNKFVNLTYCNISDFDLPNEINLKWNIIWIEDIKGPWEFNFKISKGDKATNSRVVNLNKSIKLPESTLVIDKLVISPLGNTINYSGTYDVKKEDQGLGECNFIVTDDTGRILTTGPGDLKGNAEKYYGKIEILNDISKIKSLNIVPMLPSMRSLGEGKYLSVNGNPYPILQCTVKNSDSNTSQEIITKSRPVTKKEKADGYGFDEVVHVYNIDKEREFVTLDKLANQVIKVGENDTVTIQSIEATEKETKITVKIKGSYSDRYINSMVILDEDYNDTERRKAGEIATIEDVEEKIVSIKLPAIDKSKKYKIALPSISSPEINEKYKVNISIN
ncbi:MAG: DUF4179 domain-containing protein [Clostridiaceae bacterium]